MSYAWGTPPRNTTPALGVSYFKDPAQATGVSNGVASIMEMFRRKRPSTIPVEPQIPYVKPQEWFGRGGNQQPPPQRPSAFGDWVNRVRSQQPPPQRPSAFGDWAERLKQGR